MSDKIPLVSVVILAYNRKDDVLKTLSEVYAQSYNNIEVILVDNAGSDYTSEAVRENFAQTKVIRLKTNIGIEGWNFGVKKAKGEYILLLDDDAYPERDAITNAVKIFQEDSKAGCIAFRIYDLNRDKYFSNGWLPDNESRVYHPIFVGCAAMFRKESMPMMPSDYFLYQHELPPSADIYNMGYKIIYSGDVAAYHKFKIVNEYPLRNELFGFRNNLRFINQYLSFPLALFHNIQLALFYFTRSIKYKWFGDYLKVLRETEYLKGGKEKISFAYYNNLRKLRIFNQPFVSKVGNAFRT